MTPAIALSVYNPRSLSDEYFRPNNGSHESAGSDPLTSPQVIPNEGIELIIRKMRGKHMSARSPKAHSVPFAEIHIGSQPQLVNPQFLVVDAKSSTALEIFSAIQSLYLSQNSRNRQIADRLTRLYRIALEEELEMRTDSFGQLSKFFLDNRDVGVPQIAFTPDGTLSARWFHSEKNQVVLEFTGQPRARGLAVMPRGNQVAEYFFSEPVEHVVEYVRKVGASFA